MNKIKYKTWPFFFNGPSGRLFCIHFKAETDSWNGHTVLFIPPFAEEMNKSRRMFSQQARRLATLGINSVLVDLYGTGESDGEFDSISWSVWIDDIVSVMHWLREKGSNEISIIALRLGCILAVEAAFRTNVRKIIFWQPVLKGETHISQFMRLKIAAEMSNSSGEKSTISNMKKNLFSGENIEVAGYMLSPRLVQVLEGAQLSRLMDLEHLPSTHWYELVADNDRDIPVVNRKDRKSTRLNSSHIPLSRMPSSA